MHTSVDCMYNCVAMSITYSLVVATEAFQRLCSDESTHASTLKQRVVPDSTASPAGTIWRDSPNDSLLLTSALFEIETRH